MEPISPVPDLTDWYFCGEDFDSQLSSNIYAPIRKLYSDTLFPLNVPSDFKYQPQRRPSASGQSANSRSGCFNNSNTNKQQQQGGQSHSTPLGTPSGMKAGMSPINSPRSHLTNSGQAGHDLASPSKPLASTGSNDPMKDSTRIPEASSLMLNLMLSDTILNVFRDHNFDSCTICVCYNDHGNIRGRDAAPYLPNFSGDDDQPCICGFSALMNRYVSNDETKKTSTFSTKECLSEIATLFSFFLGNSRINQDCFTKTKLRSRALPKICIIARKPHCSYWIPNITPTTITMIKSGSIWLTAFLLLLWT